VASSALPFPLASDARAHALSSVAALHCDRVRVATFMAVKNAAQQTQGAGKKWGFQKTEYPSIYTEI